MIRELGKDCENRGEEAGRLEGRYEVSKVVPPGVDAEGVYVEVLLSGSPIENELERLVGRMVNDRPVDDAALPVAFPEGETGVVL